MKTMESGVATHVVAAFHPSLGAPGKSFERKRDHRETRGPITNSVMLAELNGSYLLDCNPVKREEMLPWGRDPIDAERLWKTGEQLVSQAFTY